MIYGLAFEKGTPPPLPFRAHIFCSFKIGGGMRMEKYLSLFEETLRLVGGKHTAFIQITKSCHITSNGKWARD